MRFLNHVIFLLCTSKGTDMTNQGENLIFLRSLLLLSSISRVVDEILPHGQSMPISQLSWVQHSILWHSGIRRASDEAVLSKVLKKIIQKSNFKTSEYIFVKNFDLKPFLELA